MLMLPIVVLMTSCASSPHVISSDRTLYRLQAAKPFTPQVDGWFVPDARWQEINEAIADKISLPQK